MALQPFHLAFPVDSLEKARAFYGGLMGCPEGRSSPEWVDFDFYGHQIVAHLAPGEVGHRSTSAVEERARASPSATAVVRELPSSARIAPISEAQPIISMAPRPKT